MSATTLQHTPVRPVAALKIAIAIGTVATILCCGCGTTLDRNATEQLLTSDAVDRSVGRIDFRDLSGRRVYFDTEYIRRIKGIGFVNADYVISALRQQMVAAGCRLQDRRDEADYVVEARVGALGTDRHEVTYGIPANNFMATAANLLPSMPAVPTMPELSVAKKNDQLAAAKVAVFAYHRETGLPAWQSGISESRSTAVDTWVMGAGPFQNGTIYEGPRFAGKKLGLSLGREQGEDDGPAVAHDKEYHFPELLPFNRPADGKVVPASGKMEGSDQKAPKPSTRTESGQDEPDSRKPPSAQPDAPAPFPDDQQDE